MSASSHPLHAGELTTTSTTNNGALVPDQLALERPQRSFDDATASKTEYDSTAEEKKQSSATDDVQVDGDAVGIAGSGAGDGAETATQEEESPQGGIVYLHGIRFALIAIWYASCALFVSYNFTRFIPTTTTIRAGNPTRQP